MVTPPNLVKSSDEPCVEALLVSSNTRDHLALQRIFDHTRWHLFSCRGIDETIGILPAYRIGVVVCSDQLVDGGWMDLLESLDSMLNVPKLIVASPDPTTKLWAQVIGAGGDYVLRIPFDRTDVLRTIADAWERWFFTRVRECGFDGSPDRSVTPSRQSETSTRPRPPLAVPGRTKLTPALLRTHP